MRLDPVGRLVDLIWALETAARAVAGALYRLRLRVERRRGGGWWDG